MLFAVTDANRLAYSLIKGNEKLHSVACGNNSKSIRKIGRKPGNEVLMRETEITFSVDFMK